MEPDTARVSSKYVKNLAMVQSHRIWAFAFAWGFAEALSWPLIAEGLLAFVVILSPKRVIPAAALITLASALGVTLHAYLVSRGIHVPMPLTTDRMVVTATGQLAQEGYGALQHQLLSGIPVKVYGHAAGGGEDLSLVSLFWHTLAWRGVRIMSVALLISLAGVVLRPLLRRHYAILFYGGFVVFLLLLFRVYFSWK